MNKSFKLLIPAFPETINIEMPIGERQDGFNPDGNTIKVSDLTDEEAEEYAELLKQAFLDHHKSLK